MIKIEVEPDKVAFVVVLKACAKIAALEQGKQLHSLMLQSGIEFDVTMQNSLIDMYAKCGSLEDARQLFNDMSERNLVSWNAMITGYANNGLGGEALALYEKMKHEGVQPGKVTFVVVLTACASTRALEQGKQLHSEIRKRSFDSDVIIQSTLVDMYAKCGCLDDARELFNNMSKRNVVTWNAIIQGYVQFGLEKEALAFYEQMKQEGVQPSEVTYVVLLKACARVAALELGKELHSEIRRNSIKLDMFVQNALIDMYAKCGCLGDARDLFDNATERSAASWNAMIQGYVQNGLGREALALFEQMKKEGVQPGKVTYVSILSACSHSGLVDEGRQVFDSMCRNDSPTPILEHYACMVDLLGRAGCLANVEE